MKRALQLALTAGLTIALSGLALTPAMATESEVPHADGGYVTVAWLMPGDSADATTWPQSLAQWVETDEPNLAALDAWIDAQCGGAYQIDLYHDNQITQDLVRGGVLDSPNHPPEAHASGSDGIGWKLVLADECEVPVPAQPAVIDECGPGNAEWLVPADSAEVTWNQNESDGHLIASTTAGHVFADGTTTHDYGIAPDSNEPCVTQVAIPAQPESTDACGPDNAQWVLPVDTAEVTWAELDGHLIASATEGHVFEDGTTTHDYGVAVDSNEPCPGPQPELPHTGTEVPMAALGGAFLLIVLGGALLMTRRQRQNSAH